MNATEIKICISEATAIDAMTGIELVAAATGSTVEELAFRHDKVDQFSGIPDLQERLAGHIANHESAIMGHLLTEYHVAVREDCARACAATAT